MGKRSQSGGWKRQERMFMCCSGAMQWQNDCGQSEEQMAAEERRTRRWKIENGAAPLLTTTEG